MKAKRVLLTAGFLSLLSAAAFAGTTERVSVDSAGNQGNGISRRSSISADGRFVAFDSSASNLVSNDTNGTDDVFVLDRVTGITERVSQGGVPSISADGRYVAFLSHVNNLVPNDTNGVIDVFVYDRETETIERISVNNEGIQGNNYSNEPYISADGRYVVFVSSANNLVSNDTNGNDDIFVRDRVMGMTERVSVDSTNIQANSYSSMPSISADGRYVVFTSRASNLVANDTNDVDDVFVRDRILSNTVRVSVDSAGNQAGWGGFGSGISAYGRYVVFSSSSPNLIAGITGIHVYLRDMATGNIEIVDVDNAGNPANIFSFAYFYHISANGQYVVFPSYGANLVPGDTNGAWDLFIRDRTAQTTQRVSVDSSGEQGNSNSGYGYFGTSALSANGRYVTFYSESNNLVPYDTNEVADIFVRDIIGGCQ